MDKKGYNCIITYGSSKSNLNRVVANMSKAKGIHCHVIVSSENYRHTNESYNYQITEKLCSNITCCSKKKVYEAVREVMNNCKLEGLKPYYIYGSIYGKGNENVAVQAYVDAYDEIYTYEREVGFQFDYIFLASGTGITQAGLICGILMHGDNKKVIGISIARNTKTGKDIIFNNISSYLNNREARYKKDSITFIDKYICGGYGKYNCHILRVIRQILYLDGVPLDTTYTGKAFWGMTEYIKKNKIKGAKVLFIHTGGLPLFFDNIR